MHGLTTMHSNIITDIRIAREAGYDALEMTEAKLSRFLNLGFKADELKQAFKKYSIKPVCINALYDVELINPDDKKKVLLKADELCKIAEIINCPLIQIVAFCGLQDKPWNEILEFTSKNISDIADIGIKYSIKFQIEFISWSPINSISKGLQVLDRVKRDNVGLVIDFWQLYAGEETTVEEIAKLDKSLIFNVHFSDGIHHKKGTEWVETNLRGFLLGEGEIPLKEWVDAVKSTGYDGIYSPEIYSPKHWEWDLLEIAIESRKRMEMYLKS